MDTHIIPHQPKGLLIPVFTAKAQPFAVALEPEWVSPFLELSARVRNALPDHEKHYLKKRTQRDLRLHVSARMPMIGIVHQKKLIAGGLVTYANMDEATNIAEYPVKKDDCTTAVIQSVMCDPSCRKMGLTNHVLESAEMLAQMAGHTRLVAKIAETNKGSKDAFKRAGYAHMEKYDESGGYLAGFWAKTIGGPC